MCSPGPGACRRVALQIAAVKLRWPTSNLPRGSIFHDVRLHKTCAGFSKVKQCNADVMRFPKGFFRNIAIFLYLFDIVNCTHYVISR